MSPRPPGRAEVGRDLLALALGAAVLFFAALGARDLWQPNEPTYGQAVVEMSRAGDWVVPTVNGRIFPEKPILYFWMALASSALLGGVDEGSLRVPAAVAGTAAVLMTYLLVLPYAGRRRARLAAALLATTYAVFWNARAVQMDVLAMTFTLAVVLAVTRVADHGARPLAGWALAGLAAGLGFLGKGPVCWVCPALVLVPYLVATRRLALLASKEAAVGAAICLLVAIPWPAALVLRGEAGFLREMLFRQNVTRFLAAWDHAAPPWYYLWNFWIDMSPWGWFLPLAFALPGRDRERRRLDLLAWISIAAIVAFFSLSESKRSVYLLPVAPFVAALVAGVGERFLDGTLTRARRVAALALLVAWGALAAGGGVAALLALPPRYPEASLEGNVLGGLLVAGGAAVLAACLGPARFRRAAPTALLALVACVELLAAVAVLPAANPYKSARPFCQEVNARIGPDGSLASYRFWPWRASYAYYTGRAIPNLESPEELEEYLAGAGRAFVIVEDERLAEARRVLGDREPAVAAAIGGKTAYLFSSR